MRSKPLDIVYNPTAMQLIKDFFRTRTSQSDPLTGRRAEAKYEELKRNTQEEFRQALGRFIEGDEQVPLS